MYRTHTCWELNKSHIWQNVKLAGRVSDIRKFGGLMFFTIRDKFGTTQITCPESLSQENQEKLKQLKYEYCIQVTWIVIARPEWQTNAKMFTGEIEVELSDLIILGTSKELPFQIIDDNQAWEEARYKYRYLDLRRQKVLSNIQFRARMNHFTRNWFTDKQFTEVQTPIFTVSSPEWARDYLIPSRVNPGKFYALPQAPQQYKQLLMVWWLDKYFQIAPCFRDEDPRADRHSCEFYQIDCEMSFVDQQDVHAVAQSYILDAIPALSTKTIIDPLERLPRLSTYILPESSSLFPKIPYNKSIELFGNDKPDLRFDCRIWDITDISWLMWIWFIDSALVEWAKVKAIIIDKVITRKEIDVITEVAKQAGASGMPYIYIDNWEIKWSIAKFITPDIYAKLWDLTWLQDGQTMFIILWNHEESCKIASKIRLDLRDRYSLVDNNELSFCWIVNFPFFEKDNDGKLDFAHNPFSMVSWWVKTLQDVIDHWADPTAIVSDQYDMVCNGYEILSGSIRNHYPEVLVKVFEFVGKTEQDVRNKFWAMYEAFQYWCPPHGGFAFGFDRLLMILADETNIREVYAFPKSGRAEDAMMSAPNFVDKTQLDELHIRVVE
jgi:aspartyl-tRNA synthetase